MMSLSYQAAIQEPLLGVTQERLAIKSWQNDGDRSSLELLVRSHARQAWAQAISCANNPVHVEDLVVEGIIGLIRAANNFDLKFKVRFSTYAMWWISAGISAALARIKIVIDIPARIYIEACGNRLAKDKVAQVQMAIKGIIPLDQPIDETGAFALKTLQCPELNPEELMVEKSSLSALSRTLYKAMEVLTPAERKIIKRLKLKHNPDCARDLAVEMKMTQTRLRQLERHALMRLRNALLSCGFELEMLG
ncbi:MAG: sigma-70 family RNA polymerase sigma factor [Amylibacter sp.]|nr:sigma-70 family RNA polymerase sigma factor [Amylibacter sp.]